MIDPNECYALLATYQELRGRVTALPLPKEEREMLMVLASRDKALQAIARALYTALLAVDVESVLLRRHGRVVEDREGLEGSALKAAKRGAEW